MRQQLRAKTAAGYKVDSNIPIPPKRYTRPSKYPFGTMSVNASVFMADKTYQAIMGLLRLHKAKGKRFVVRSMDKGYRIWRVK